MGRDEATYWLVFKRVAVGENGEIKGVAQLLFKNPKTTIYIMLCLTWVCCGL